VIRVKKSGGRIKIIGGFTDSTKDHPHMVWYVKENSPIRTAMDLVGKKIAGLTGKGEGIELVGCTGYGAAEFLRLGGIDIKKAGIEGVTLPVAQMEQALKQGLVDVTTAHPPFTGKLSNTPGFRELFSDYDAIAPTYGRGATSIAVVREEWLKNNPEAARNFVAALALAADWATAHQDEAKQIYAKRLEIAPENVKYLSTYAWMPHLFIDEKRNIQFYIDMMVKYGELKPGQVKASDVYSRDFNPYYRLVTGGKIKESDILKEAEAIAARNYPSYLKKGNVPKRSGQNGNKS
jgi:ABC-type nitrate/sulfonate/bicarbonate transport system substrate-binding protein